MELELKRNQVSCYNTILDTSLLHEETLEVIVPDASPDILRLADTAGVVCLKQKEAQDGRAEVAGVVRCAVLYLPDGATGGHRIEVDVPFRCGVDHASITPSCTIVAMPWLQAADTRVLNPRKVLVRVNLAIAVRVFAPADLNLCSGVEAPEAETGIQQLCRSHDAYVVSCVQEKNFTFSDDLTLPGGRPAAEELLRSRVTLHCDESKIIGNKLIFKGEACLQILYRCPEGGVHSADFALPFSQIMEIAGVAEEADCAVEVQLTGLSCLLDGNEGRSISVTMELLAQAVIREERSLTVLEDIYCVGRPLTAEMERCELRQLTENSAKRQTVREIIETPVLAKTALDAYVSVGAVTQGRDGERTVFTAEAVITVLYEGEDGDLTAAVCTLSVPCPLELPEQCLCTCRCSCPGAVYASPTTGGIEVRLELEFRYMALTAYQVGGVTRACLEEAAESGGEERPSIILRMVGSEGLWDLAKAYGTTMEDIMRANELEEKERLSGRLLLIPKKR